MGDAPASWRAEASLEWVNMATAHLPFVPWREFQTLRDVGSAPLHVPLAPCFSLFLHPRAAHVDRFNEQRGVTNYAASAWAADAIYEGRVRDVRYDVAIAADGADATRRRTIVERQRCTLTETTLLFEVRATEEVRASEGDAAPDAALKYDLVERWEIVEVRGFVNNSTTLTARAGSSSGRWTEEALRRFEAWSALAQQKSYADAVATMLSDSLFGCEVPLSKGAAHARHLAPFIAPVPPTRVDVVMEVDDESGDAADSRAPELRETPLGAFHAGKGERLGHAARPWTPADLLEARLTAKPAEKRGGFNGNARTALLEKRAPGAVYEVAFAGDVGIEFAPLASAHGACVVDGVRADFGGDGAPPRVGAALVSVNGVRVAGLSFASSMALVRQPPPLRLGFVEADADHLLDAILAVEVERAPLRCSRAAVERAMAAPGARPLREKLDDFEKSFASTDLARSHRPPQDLIWACVEFAAEFLREHKLLRAPGNDGAVAPSRNQLTRRANVVDHLLGRRRAPSNEADAAAGLDADEELDDFWDAAKDHIERRVMGRLFDSVVRLSPDFGRGDDELRRRLSRLRFLKLEHLGVVVQDGSESAPGAEWAVAQLELQRVAEARSVSEMLDRLQASVRFIASAVEATANRGKPLACYSAIGADELLPAITWTVIQANPPRLASTLWVIEHYGRKAQLRQEKGYAFANFCAAVAFARERLDDAAPLEGLISVSDFRRGVQLSALCDKALDAASRADARTLRLVFAAGADPLALSVDHAATPLHAALQLLREPDDGARNRKSDAQECVEACLAALRDRAAAEQPAAGYQSTSTALTAARPKTGLADVAVRRGELQGQTALMVAVSVGSLAATLGLLDLGADTDLEDARGRSAADLAREFRHADCLEALTCGDPREASLAEAAARGDGAKVRGLLLRGAAPGAACERLKCTPLVAAAAAGASDCVAALLDAGADVDGTDASGATALMWAVGVSKKGASEAAYAQICVSTALLRAGASRFKKDADGHDALHWATSFGGGARLRHILANDPVRVKLFDVAKDGAFDRVVALLDQGADADEACPDKGYTPLVAATYNGDVRVAAALLAPPRGAASAAASADAAGRNGLTPLMYAAQKKSLPLVSLLLRHGADRDRRCARGKTALDHVEDARATPAAEEAAEAAEATRVLRQLRELLSVDPGKVLLVEAAARGDAVKVSALLAQGASPNQRRWLRSKAGWHLELSTPLIAAAAYDCAATADVLLRARNVDVDAANPLGQTPLMYAAMRGSADMLLRLLKAGATRGLCDRHGRTALAWGVRRAKMDSETIKRAGAKGMAPGSATDRADRLAVPLLRVDLGTHSTMGLAAAGDVDGVVALIKLGADVNASDRASPCGETALLACCAAGQADVLRRLLRHPNILPDLASSRGVTPTMQAAAAGFDDGVLLLLRAGARRGLKTPQGRSAADYATEHGHVALAALLSADPKQTSIHDVAAAGRLLIISGLLRQQPDLLNARRKTDGATPLLVAAANKRLKAVELLLSQPNVDVDAPNARRETALMHAAAAGALDVCSRLVAKGASPGAKDVAGCTASSWACKKSYSNMVLFSGMLMVT